MNTVIEIWKDVKGYEGVYKISSFGNVKSLSRTVKGRYSPYTTKERILKPTPTATGYLAVTFYGENKKKTTCIHQLVAISFLNHNPCGYNLVVNHINHNPIDNRVENLEIITQRENASKKHIKSSSIYTGVVLDKVSKLWKSFIIVNKKRVHLGYFKNEKEASEYYEAAKICVLENRIQDIIIKGRSYKTIGTSKLKTGKWQARVKINNKWKTVGCFIDEETAKNAATSIINKLKIN